MEPVRELVRSIEIDAGKERYFLTLESENFSALYPGMVRYSLTVTDGERIISDFRTNSFEYSPRVPLAAEMVAEQTADEWEREIRKNPLGFIMNHRHVEPKRPAALPSDLVVIQGS
ncbi:MAG: flavodoxin family protein, partial [Methanoregula sp.]|nr:flavodoxin family protein [Methanoregula sp.]